jgi:mannosyltransferase
MPMVKNSLHQCRGTLSLKYYPRIIVIFAGYLVRILSLDFQDMWRDEVDQWLFTLDPLKKQLTRFFDIGWNGPLFSPLLRLWITGTGDSVFAMRYFSLLWGVLSISLIYILCKRLVDRKTAMVSAILWAFSPYSVWYSQEIKMYTWVPMLILFALYSLEKAVAKPNALIWLQTITVTCLAFYSHILAVLVIPVEILWFWLTPHRHIKAWIGGGLALLLLSVPYIPLFAWQMPMVFATRETGYPDYTFSEMVTALLSGWTNGIYTGAWTGGRITNFIMVYACVFALTGIFAGIYYHFRQFGKLLVWLLVPMTIVWAISLRNPLFTDRYLIWCAPAFTMLVAYGLTCLGKIKSIYMWVACTVAVLTTFPALYSQSTIPIKPQFSKAVEYINSHHEKQELLLFQIPYNARVYEFYARNIVYTHEDAPYTNWKDSARRYTVDESYVQQEMSRLLRQYSQIWLVYSEAKLWDERELVRNWLDKHWKLVDEKHFQGVSLFMYRRPWE